MVANMVLSEYWDIEARFNQSASRIRIEYSTYTPHALSIMAYALPGARVWQVSRDTVLEGVRFRHSSDSRISMRLLPTMGVFSIRLSVEDRMDWLDIHAAALNKILHETVAMVPQGHEHLHTSYDWDQGLERIESQNKTWMSRPPVARCGSCGLPVTSPATALCEGCQ